MGCYKVGRVQAEDEKLAGEASLQYIEGYEVALSHAWAIFPKLDLSAFSPFKEIKHDQLENPVEQSQVEQANILETVKSCQDGDKALQDARVVDPTSGSLLQTASEPVPKPTKLWSLALFLFLLW